jgi:hypothetical protein
MEGKHIVMGCDLWGMPVTSCPRRPDAYLAAVNTVNGRSRRPLQ